MFNISSLVSSVRRLGALTLEQLVAKLGPTFWGDATETYAKSKIAVDLPSGGYLLKSGLNSDFGFGTGDFTVSCWVYADTFSTDNQILDFRNGTITEDRIALWHNSTQGVRLYLSGSYILQYATPLSPSTWYHIVLQKRSGTFYLYVDNDLKDSVANTTTLLDSPLYVGIYSGGDSEWDGRFDQLTVIKGDGEESTMTALYNSTFGLNHKDLDGTETFYNNIVAWYDFNVPKNSGRNYNEESHAVLLSGSEELQSSTTTGLDFGDSVTDSPFSIVGWIYPTTLSGGANNPIVGKNNTIAFNCGNGGLELYLGDSGFGNTIYHLYNTGISVNNWYHVCATYDGSSSQNGISLYINGVEVVGTRAMGGTYTAMHSSNNIRIGGRDLATRFIGRIDEVAIYSDELTAPEVTTLYNGGTVAPARTLHTDNLVSDWSFNEQDPALVGGDVYGSNDLTPTSIVEADLVGGKDSLDLTEVSITSANAVLGHIEGKAAGFDGLTRWTDRSTNGNDASQSTITAIPLWKENVLNTTEDVIEFDGGTTARWLDIPTNTGYMDGVTDKPYTWCFLFKMDELRNNNFLLGENTNPYSWYWYINSSGTLVLRSFDKSVNAYKATTVSAGFPAFPAETWTFLAVTYSSTNEFIVYKDAIDVSDVSGTVGAYVAMEDLPVRLGNYAGSSNNTFKGQIAQTKYFEKELTQDEVTLIKDYYNEKYGLSL